MGDYPLVPLLILLILLVAVLQILRPGIVNERWIANTVKFAIPLAMLAGCQTLTMLTGGIDLSVATVATMAAFIMATQVVQHDPAVALLLAFGPALLIGLANGIGVGVFRVHPLIMTLGTSLIGTGCLQVYQRTVIATGTKVPDTLAWLGTGLTWGVPNALLVFLPVAALIMFTLRRTGFGRLLYAVGDNERATRISGVLYWQVILALYVASALLAAVTGLLYVGLIKAPSLSLADPLLLPSVAAAVIGGTSIFGGRGGYAGTILGALILTVLTTLLTAAADARGLPPHALRRHHPARHGRLPAHHRGPLTPPASVRTIAPKASRILKSSKPLCSHFAAGLQPRKRSVSTVLPLNPRTPAISPRERGPSGMRNSTGAVIRRGASGGGAGTGEARRTSASTSASRAAWPDERAILAERTLPASSMAKETWTTPSSRLPRDPAG